MLVYLPRAGIPSINNGIFLFRPSEALFKQMLAILHTPWKAQRTKIITDQDVMIEYARRHPRKVKPLSLEFNLRPQHASEADWRRASAGVLHFTGLPKPWQIWLPQLNGSHQLPLLPAAASFSKEQEKQIQLAFQSQRGAKTHFRRWAALEWAARGWSRLPSACA